MVLFLYHYFNHLLASLVLSTGKIVNWMMIFFTSDRWLTVCYYHVLYEFQTESTLVCLNVKELLAQSRRHIWSLSDSNEIWARNHLVPKRRLNHLVKLAKYWISLLSLKLQIWRLLWARSSLTFKQTIESGFTLKFICDMIITYRLPSNLHLHLQVLCQDSFLVLLILDIRLNTLIFQFSTTWMHNLAYGLLISL